MIPKQVTIKGVETQVAFEGDQTVQWFIKDMGGTNRDTPQIKRIVNGTAFLECDPRSIGMTMDLLFYTEGESMAAAKIDEAVEEYGKLTKMKLKTKNWIMDTVKQSPRFIKIFLAVTVGLFLMDMFLAPEDEPQKILDNLEEFERCRCRERVGRILRVKRRKGDDRSQYASFI